VHVSAHRTERRSDNSTYRKPVNDLSAGFSKQLFGLLAGNYLDFILRRQTGVFGLLPWKDINTLGGNELDVGNGRWMVGHDINDSLKDV